MALALDVAWHSQGLGAELLHDAMDRIVTAADAVSGQLIVVNAVDDAATAFYRHHDFQPVRDHPHRLVIKVSTVRKAIGR